jgi:glycosyltransferase involved in cell wall biosynthesis
MFRDQTLNEMIVSTNPYVSIGLPVFNGEDFLEEAIDSILIQTFTNFELILCDNASTDSTPQICKEYAKKDSRIRYYRNQYNVGAPRNYNRTVKLSRGKYFKWAAADDLHAPEYLQKCVEILDNNPSIVLCHTKMNRINEEGLIVGTYDHIMRMDSPKIEERFRDLISIMTNICFPMFGLMRKDILVKTPLHGDYRGADANLLAELSLYGRLHEIPEYLFYRRDHSKAYTHTFCSNKKVKGVDQQQKSWWSSSSWINYTNMKNCYEFFNSVNRVPLELSEKILCYRQIFRWFYTEGWKLFGNDVEQYFLGRFSAGRTSIKVVKSLMSRVGINIVDREN